MVTRQLKQKLEDGSEITVDIGAMAENIVTDRERQFVTGLEKESLGNIKKLEERVENIDQQVSGVTSSKISTVVSDLAKLAFQLEVKNVTDTSNMTHVIVDEVDSATAIVIVSGTYADNKVYI